jgi:hypothetical protein
MKEETCGGEGEGRGRECPYGFVGVISCIGLCFFSFGFVIDFIYFWGGKGSGGLM